MGHLLISDICTSRIMMGSTISSSFLTGRLFPVSPYPLQSSTSCAGTGKTGQGHCMRARQAADQLPLLA